MWTYKDGTGVERCEICFAAKKQPDGHALVSVRVCDVEELICFFRHYVYEGAEEDMAEVWGPMLTRLEREIGQTYEQIKERLRCERLSKEVSTS